MSYPADAIHGTVVCDTAYIVQATINIIVYECMRMNLAHNSTMRCLLDFRSFLVMHANSLSYQKPEGGGEDADPANDVAEERDDQGEG